MFNSLFTTVRLRLRRLTRTVSRFQILPIKNRGYVMLLVTMVIPLLLYGVKWVLDARTILSTSRAVPQGVIFKRCAKDAALAVAKKWNPSLTLKQQKESMLRIADEVYNAAPAYSTATPTYDAIPGLEMPKKHTTTKSGAYNPVKVNVTEYTSLSPSAKTVAYKSQSTNLVRYYFYTSFGALRAPSISRYFYLIRDCRGARPSPLVTEDIFSDFYCYRRESQYDDFYITTTALQTLSKKDGSSNVGTKSYTIRSNANDSTVQVSVQDDKIKVITDNDIGYATPASCNVDIILGIPVNNATLNQNNYDTNTPTAGSPHVSTSASVTNDVKSTPIYQISRAYRTFLKNNFFYTRGVNVGVIPYSGKVSLYRDRSAWIQAPKNFVTTYFLDQNNYPAYIRGSMMYGSNGTAGGSLTSLSVATGNTTGQMESKGFKYSYGIMARGSRDVLYAGNYVNVGDLLSVAEPTNDSTKFQEVYLQPCYSGYTNLLSMQCEKNCDVCYINPFSIMEFSSDLQFTYEMLQLFYPHENKKNDSNFIFIPFTWANNLLQSWNTTGAISAVNTTSDTTNLGRLSCPSKMTANRKKALILVVNKPDWFEPGELTYLGFDNDFSEIPVVEGDCIRGDINYSDTSLKYADGSQYDNTIQGAKKILKMEVLSGSMPRNATTGYYECGGNGKTTVRFTFPTKGLLKIVLGPADPPTQSQTVTIPVAIGDIIVHEYALNSQLGPDIMGWNAIACSGNTCIAIDKDGYVSKTSNMHDEYWEEFGQQLPYRITDGWYTYDGIQFCALTYYKSKWLAAGRVPNDYSLICYSSDGRMWGRSETDYSYGGPIWYIDSTQGVWCLDELPGICDLSSSSDWLLATNRYGAYEMFNNLGGSAECGNTMFGIFDQNWYSACVGDIGYAAVGDYYNYICPFDQYRGYTYEPTDLGSVSNFTRLCNGGDKYLGALGINGEIFVGYDQDTNNGKFRKWISVPFNCPWEGEWRGLAYNSATKEFIACDTEGDIVIIPLLENTVKTEQVVLTGDDAKHYAKFTNISNSSFSNGTKNSMQYEITKQMVFYVEPSQIGSTDSSGKYCIDMNLQNIRLISAEITNRPYAVVTPTVTKSGSSGSVTFTANCKCAFHAAVKKTADNATLSYTSASGTNASQTIASNKVIEISPSTHQYAAHYDANGNPYYTIAVTTSGCSITGVYPGTLKQFSGSASGLTIDSNSGGNSGDITLNNGDKFSYTKTVVADSSGTATVSGNKITCPIGAVLHVKAVPSTQESSVTFYGDNRICENTGPHEITEPRTFTFKKGFVPNGEWWRADRSLSSNFDGNLSQYKIRYSLSNAKITSCVLNEQILRDYMGIYSLKVNNFEGSDQYDKYRDSCIKVITNSPNYNISDGRFVNSVSGSGKEYKIRVYGIDSPFTTFSVSADPNHTIAYRENNTSIESYTLQGSHWREQSFSHYKSPYIELMCTNPEGGFFMASMIRTNTPKTLNPDCSDEDIKLNACIGLRTLNSGSSSLPAGSYICFQGDGQLQVTVEPIKTDIPTITFNCPNENNTAHELWNEWNFCLESSQMTNNGNGTQSLTYSTTGDVTVTATYEYKDRFKLELKKPTNVAQASYTISGHKKEMKWKKATLPSTAKWTGICYGGDKFVTVSQSSVNAAYSTDGIAWHASTLPSSQQWRGIGYGHGTYIAPGYSSSVAAYSQDGITWNQVTLPANRMWYAVCYGYDKFVAVAQNSNTIIYSQNGINWSTSTLPSSTDWKSICYAKDKFVAVPGAGNNRDIAAYSSNGINWTQSSLPSSQGWNSVCYGGIGKFVTVAGQQSTTTTVGAYSNDGQSWYQFTLPTSSRWASVCYGSNVFITVSGYNASSNKAAYSVNGINWITSTLPVSAAWWEISYGNGTFVCVAGGYNTSTNTAAYTTFHDGVIWDASNRQSISRDTNAANSLGFSENVDDSVQVEATNETITGISITYLKVISPDPMIEFKKIRLPDMSRTVDFSVNSSGKPSYNSSLIAFGTDNTGSLSKTGVKYDNSLGYWITAINTAGNATHCYYAFNYNKNVPGDFFSLTMDIGNSPAQMDLVTRSGKLGGRHVPGLYKVFQFYNDTNTAEAAYFDFLNVSSGRNAEFVMTGFTLPINAMLYYGAQGTTLHKYQWQSDTSGKWNNLGATEAVKKVTQDACAKLKSDWGANLRVYLIKFRKQAQYKHKVTGAATNFDYTYLNNCATGTSAPYMYDISSESDLNNALSAIATDIKSWAGYQAAKNL